MNSLRVFLSVTGMCFAFLLLLPPALSAQTWTMPVDGKVLVGNDRLTGSIVTLFKGTTQLQQVVTTSNGKFSFELQPDGEYIIAVTKPGYITKKFKINTAHVPAERAKAGNFNPFEPDVTLFEMPTAPEISKRVEAILSQPLAIYQYIIGEDNFNYDEKYTRAIQDKLAELSQLQKQVEKEMESRVKNAADEAVKQLELEKKYKAAIDKADISFGNTDYANAKASYNDALGIKPGEAYPKQKIAEINNILANTNKQKDLDAKYQAAIAKGDKSFGSKDYVTAKAGYTEASTLKTGELYPKQKLTEIDKLLTDVNKQKEIDAKYQAAIAKGDGAFTAKDYTAAKNGYSEASGIKPVEQYPKTKIAEIDKLLADAGRQKEIDAKYQAAIEKADNAFNAKDYTTAKSGYTEAAGIKALEKYPKTKLAEIDKLLADANKLLADANKQKEIDAKYQAAIAKGDAAFGTKDYIAAKTGYTEASGVKPAEQYPKTKLAEIAALLAEMAKAGDLNKKYNDLIAKGDNFFSQKKYTDARSSFSDASSVKSSEQYPKIKIAEIDKLLAELSSQRSAAEKEQQYNDAVARAEKLFAAKSYPDSRSAYNEALGIKSAEQYPKIQIALIDKILADLDAQRSADAKQKEQDEKYKAAIAKADKLLSASDYANAKTSYSEALAIKPAEQYPQTRIAEIDKLLAELASKRAALSKEEQYNDVIAKGNAAITAKNYTDARAFFVEAGGLKPLDQYPKQKIMEIDAFLKSLAAQERNKKYNEAVLRGGQNMIEKDYITARISYQDALTAKPLEQFPKDKIAEIDKILKVITDKQNSGEVVDKNYLAAVERGDVAFKDNSFANAKVAYNEALTYKPSAAYPQEKLAEINKLESAQWKTQADAGLQKKYDQAISKGDNAFALNDYSRAKAGYEEALSYKPAEKYPKDKLKVIAGLLKNTQVAEAPKKNKPISEEEKKKKYVSELRSKYPAGITEEEYTEGNKVILRRVVIREDFAGVYIKVTHNWGGIYFFRDDASITETMFENESK